MKAGETVYRGRFAPSPTGPLHFGSLVAAVGSFLQARSAGGVWLIRVDDIDPPREVAGAARAIIDLLAAFGMEPDEPVLFQSQCAEAHAAALEQLQEDGRLFACGCSRRDLDGHRVYPGTCRLGLPPGRRPRSLRVRVDHARIAVRDAVQGDYVQELGRDVGDFVVRRADGLTAYHLACVVGDAVQEITEVIRGADLLPSTSQQVFLQRLLGFPTPRYGHLPVVLDADGRKLSKQTRAAPVEKTTRRAALSAALGFLGHPPPPGLQRAPLSALWRWAVEYWDLERVPRRNSLWTSDGKTNRRTSSPNTASEYS